MILMINMIDGYSGLGIRDSGLGGGYSIGSSMFHQPPRPSGTPQMEVECVIRTYNCISLRLCVLARNLYVVGYFIRYNDEIINYPYLNRYFAFCINS